MLKQNDGGSAFPKYVGGNRDLADGEESGMTLLDYFAGQAIAGVLANLGAMDPDVRDSAGSCAIFARDCYRMADALLAERNKRRAAVAQMGIK